MHIKYASIYKVTYPLPLIAIPSLQSEGIRGQYHQIQTMSRIIAGNSCHQSNHLKIYWQDTSLALTANVHGLSSEEVTMDIRDRRVFLIVGHEYHETVSFEMPQNVNLNQTKTLIENGVLNVTVPKVKNKKKNPAVVSHTGGCRGRFFC